MRAAAHAAATPIMRKSHRAVGPGGFFFGEAVIAVTGDGMTLLAVAALVGAIGQEGNFHTPPIVYVAMRIDASARLDGSA